LEFRQSTNNNIAKLNALNNYFRVVVLDDFGWSVHSPEYETWQSLLPYHIPCHGQNIKGRRSQ